MPRRSNPFQSLVAFIEKALGGTDVVVEESVLLTERGTGDEREADIVADAVVNGHPVRIAIECRDHRRPQDKTWIDSLVGKYASLPVDKVVAVSSSGFTTGAVEKAKQHRIDTLTFEEALDHDWPQEFQRIYIKFVTQRVATLAVELEYAGGTRPPEQGDALKPMQIVSSSGESDGTLEEVVMRLYETDARAAAEQFLRQHMPEKLQESRDRVELVLVPYELTDRYLVDRSGQHHELKRITLKISYEVRLVDARQVNYVYNRTQVSIGSVDVPGRKEEVAVAIVQLPAGYEERFRLAQKVVIRQARDGETAQDSA